MAVDDQRKEQFLNQPDDNTRNLYIGHIDLVKGKVNGTLEANFAGEILLYGHPEDDIFVVEQLRRLALYGKLQEPNDFPELGIISLAGPISNTQLVPTLDDPKSGTVFIVHLQLHYDDLTKRRRAIRYSGDAVFPRVEVLLTNLTWKQEGVPDESKVQLIVGLPASNLVGQVNGEGLIQSVTFDPLLLPFHLAGTGPSISRKQHNSLGGCPDPIGKCGPCNKKITTPVRQLPLKFINITQKTAEELEALCQTQITNACRVWRDKAGLELDIDPQIGGDDIDVMIKDNYQGILTSTQQSDLYDSVPPSGNPPDYVPIYLVTGMRDSDGQNVQGFTRNCGQASAFSLLRVGRSGRNPIENSLQTNPFLLAHEVGHILGISHPGDSTPEYFPDQHGFVDSHLGAAGSVMQMQDPNVNINTCENFEIFDKWPGPTTINIFVPLNAICLADPSQNDCFRPD
ncbi:MAG: hypothetical protein KDI79_29100 [Anaerolineae bacterium]|nr:hypothetical protein [Anaerolineae bacterium]